MRTPRQVSRWVSETDDDAKSPIYSPRCIESPCVLASDTPCRYVTVYFDGLEGHSATGPLSESMLHQGFFDQLEGDALVESSSSGGFNWHLNTRTGQTDWAATDRRAFLDYTKGPNMLSAKCSSLDTPDMGKLRQGNYEVTSLPCSLDVSVYAGCSLRRSRLTYIACRHDMRIVQAGGAMYSTYQGLTLRRHQMSASTWRAASLAGTRAQILKRPWLRLQPTEGLQIALPASSGGSR
eukprot:COSAG06_NODE_1784_length_8405_cov_15.271129_3_plen_237_part_00